MSRDDDNGQRRDPGTGHVWHSIEVGSRSDGNGELISISVGLLAAMANRCGYHLEYRPGENFGYLARRVDWPGENIEVDKA